MKINLTRWPAVREGLLLACVAAAYVAVRLPLLRPETIELGWNSDAAIMGLMQRRLFLGQRFPVYFFGQSYMGPLTAFFGALSGWVLQLRGGPCCGPWALRTGAMLEVATGIAFYCAGLRIAFGRAVSLLVAFWLALGPYFLYEASLAPIGGEIAFTVSGLLFWFAAARVTSPHSRWSGWHLAMAGLLCGFGWWMNQGCVFVIAGAVAALALRYDPIRRILATIRPMARLRLSGSDLGWRSISRRERALLLFAESVPFALLVLVALPLMGVQGPSLFWEWPIGEPLALLAAIHLAADQHFGGDLTSALGALLRRDLHSWRFIATDAALFAAGILLALLPVIAGRLSNDYPGNYGLSVPMMELSGIPPQILRTLGNDLWRFLGVDRGVPGLAGAVAFVAVLVFLLLARPRGSRPARALAVGTIVFSLLFYAGSSRATSGAVRYMVAALPLWMAFFAEGVARLWSGGGVARRAFALAAVLAYTAALAGVVAESNERFARGDTAEYALFPGNFDPRPVIRTIEAEGYRICYANYWIATKLQWLSGEKIRFIPYLSYDRLPEESALLRAAPGPKCFVDPAGEVTPFAGQPVWSPKRR